MVLPSTPGVHIPGGVKTNVFHAISQQGQLQSTSSMHDLAVNGDGFLVVEDGAGEIYLTRSGSFVPDGEGRLVNAAGFRLMGHGLDDGGRLDVLANGLEGLQPVVLEDKTGTIDRFEIGGNGVVTAFYKDGEQEALYQIPLADVTSPDRLTVLSGNVYGRGPQSGDIEIGLPRSGSFGTLVPGTVESSNADMTADLTDMIEAEHLYAANAKVMQTGSDLLKLLLDLKK